MLSKNLLRILREDINAALVEAGKKHNMTLHAGNCSYSGDTATFKLEVQTVGGLSKEAQAFNELASAIGMEPDDLGRTLYIDGKEFKIAGYLTRARNNNILIESADSKKRSKINISMAKILLNAHGSSQHEDDRVNQGMGVRTRNSAGMEPS